MTAAAVAESKFEGWEKPESNFFKVPNEFWLIEDLTPHERMVLLYILRHTWGFQEFGVMKHIMIDEFQHGRLAADGKRMDKGCGVSRGKASEALKSLEAKGYIQVVTDVTDPARVKKFVMLNMLNSSQDSVQQMNPAFSKRTQRSNGDTRTEKDTKERNKENTPLPPQDADDTSGKSLVLSEMQEAVRKHLKQYGRQNEQVAKSLLGLHVGKNESLNLSRKFTPALLEKFGLWWDTNYRKDGKPLTRPKNLDSVKSYGEEFLAQHSKPKPVEVITAPTPKRPSVKDFVVFEKPPKEQAG